MKEIRYIKAIAEALREEMERDENVFVVGEDVGGGGGAFGGTKGLLETFGERRVKDTPISESAIVGIALGAAVRGLRPVAEIMFADFLTVCMDQIVNQLAKTRYMSPVGRKDQVLGAKTRTYAGSHALLPDAYVYEARYLAQGEYVDETFLNPPDFEHQIMELQQFFPVHDVISRDVAFA